MSSMMPSAKPAFRRVGNMRAYIKSFGISQWNQFLGPIWWLKSNCGSTSYWLSYIWWYNEISGDMVGQLRIWLASIGHHANLTLMWTPIDQLYWWKSSLIQTKAIELSWYPMTVISDLQQRLDAKTTFRLSFFRSKAFPSNLTWFQNFRFSTADQTYPGLNDFTELWNFQKEPYPWTSQFSLRTK